MKQVKVIFLRRKWWAAAGCLLAAILILCVVNHPAVVGASAATRQLPIYCVEKDYKVLSISFDAAWGNEDTQQLIDILGKYSIKATFFVVGEWVDKYPESVKALHDAGHEVMSHSNDHAHFNSLSTEEITADLNACNDKIEAVTGVRPTLFRCPYGEYDDHVINAVRALGMEPIQWDVERLERDASPWGAARWEIRAHGGRDSKARDLGRSRALLFSTSKAVRRKKGAQALDTDLVSSVWGEQGSYHDQKKRARCRDRTSQHPALGKCLLPP